MSLTRNPKTVELYKKMIYLGRDYPLGLPYFRDRLKTAFLKHREEKDPEKIRVLVKRGEYMIRELEAMYKLRKYRSIKQRYEEDN